MTAPIQAVISHVAHKMNAVVKLALDVQYPDEYPEVLPDLSLETLEGSIDEEEIEHLLDELRRMVCPFPAFPVCPSVVDGNLG